MPDAAAAVASNAMWITGMSRALYGNGPTMMEPQQAGSTMMVRFPSAFNTRRIAMDAPHP